MTEIVVPESTAVATLDDQSSEVIALLEQASQALAGATTLEGAQQLLAKTKVIESAARAVKLTVATISDAAALRVRAERRMGELLAVMPKNTGAMGIGGPSVVDSADRTPTLADYGITKDESAGFQRLANVPELVFEEALAAVKDEAVKEHAGVTTGAVLRKINPEQERRPDEHWLRCDLFVDRCKRLADDAPDVLAAVRFGQYPADQDGIVYAAALAELARCRDVLIEIHSEIQRRHP